MGRIAIAALLLCCGRSILCAAEEERRVAVGKDCVVITKFTMEDIASLIAINKLRTFDKWPVYGATNLPAWVVITMLPEGSPVNSAELTDMRVTVKELGDRTAFFFYDSKRAILVLAWIGNK